MQSLPSQISLFRYIASRAALNVRRLEREAGFKPTRLAQAIKRGSALGINELLTLERVLMKYGYQPPKQKSED